MPLRNAPPEDLRPLTVLRFFAAGWVVLYDYLPRLVVHLPTLVTHGYLGVEIFFVLSGFILTHVYGRQFVERRFHYGEFLWARLARIYPVHIATLIGLAALIGAARLLGADVGEAVTAPTSLPAELLLLHGWGFAPLGGWNHPSWSLSAEWFAYVAFPLFAVTAGVLRHRPRLAVGLAIASGGAAYAAFPTLAGFQLTSATTHFGWLRIVPPFALGCALHMVWRALPRRPDASLAGPAIAAATAISAGAAAMLAGLPDAVVVAAAGALILALAALPPRAGRGGSMAALVYLGEVSFSLYMMVMPWEVVYENGLGRLLHLPDKALLPPLAWMGLVAGLLPAAMVLHHLVERPAREIMRRRGPPFSRRGRAIAPPEGVEPAFRPVDA